ncbi:single-stranded DNA-binding protein [Jeotgalibaca porci]|uniref:single-stranded DNA-binding protein n=1 Tax=Jeotgalibaca porci TaxID=1868793 RepID=UPI00359F9354
MMNSVQLIGRLTKDIDLRYTQSGTAVGSFNLAVERNFKNADGERETDFIRCQIWRKAAENLEKFTSKGSLIGIEGSVQTRNYENNQGQRVYVTEINVDNFTLLESKKDSQNNNASGTQNNDMGEYNQQTQNTAQGQYGANNASQFGGFANQQNSINVTDDQLPF